MAIVAGAIAAAAAGQAHSDNIVRVPPADLPALARQPGEAMLLHDTLDGRTLLYIEQKPGAWLATFDVSDPVHLKGEESVKLEASGPFDFIFPLGNQGELVRFRQRQIGYYPASPVRAALLPGGRGCEPFGGSVHYG